MDELVTAPSRESSFLALAAQCQQSRVGHPNPRWPRERLRASPSKPLCPVQWPPLPRETMKNDLTTAQRKRASSGYSFQNLLLSSEPANKMVAMPGDLGGSKAAREKQNQITLEGGSPGRTLACEIESRNTGACLPPKPHPPTPHPQSLHVRSRDCKLLG